MKWKRNNKTNVVSTNEEIIRICEEEGKKKKSHIPLGSIVVLIFALGAAGYFGYCLWCYYQEYQDDQKLYGDLREAVLQVNDEPELPTEEIQSTEKLMSESSVKKQRIKKKKDQLQFEVNWEELEEINKDIIGWVYFTGLPQISYPILQAEDNAYYVNRTYDLSSDTSKAGSIFMDYRMASDFSSPYSIIYGHNVRDGSMLSDLVQLKDQILYDEEPYFWILTPKGNYRYQIFSIFQCHRSADVFQRSFDCWGEDFSKWQSELKLRNSMQGDVKLKEYGHVVVFSTCVPNS